MYQATHKAPRTQEVPKRLLCSTLICMSPFNTYDGESLGQPSKYLVDRQRVECTTSIVGLRYLLVRVTSVVSSFSSR